MAKENLIPLSDRSPEEKKRIASLGGKKSAERRQYNKSFKQAVEWALSLPAMKGNPTVDMIKKQPQFRNLTNQDALVISVLARGVQEGDVKVLTAMRDTVGESPTQQLAFGNSQPMEIKIEVVE